MNILAAGGLFALNGARHAVDCVDDAFLLLLAVRRQLVSAIVPIKHRLDLPLRDPGREVQVRARAQRLARRLRVPDAAARRLIDALIQDACLQQSPAFDLGQGAAAARAGMIASVMTPAIESKEPVPSYGFLRWLPPPRRLGTLLRLFPRRWQGTLAELAVGRGLAPLMDGDALEFVRGRRLGVEVSDLGARWTFAFRDGRIHVCEEEPEVTVRGSLTDLLLLAGRLEDADTLFFQRRLMLTGDTEFGLTVRNVLDRLPWEDIPLGIRIALNRFARFARAARSAHDGIA